MINFRNPVYLGCQDQYRTLPRIYTLIGRINTTSSKRQFSRPLNRYMFSTFLVESEIGVMIS